MAIKRHRMAGEIKMSMIFQKLLEKFINENVQPATGNTLNLNLSRIGAKGVFYDISNNRNEMFIISSYGESGIFKSTNYGKTWDKVFQRVNVPVNDHMSFYRHNLGYGFVWTAGGNFCRTTPDFIQAETFSDMYHPLNCTVGIDESPTDGTIMFAEYGGAGGIDGKRIWKSTNYGASWAVAHEDLGVGHWHSCQRDPYTGDWWACSGDADAGVKIKRSTDNGVTWTTVSGGSQQYRTCGVMFSEDYILWVPDDPNALPGSVKMYKIHRDNIDQDWTTNRIEVSSNIEGPSYGIFRMRDGRFLFWTTAEDREYSCLYISDGNTVKKIMTTNRTPGSNNLSAGFTTVSKPDYNNRVLIATEDCGLRSGNSIYVATLPLGGEL